MQHVSCHLRFLTLKFVLVIRFFEAHLVRDCGDDNTCDTDLQTEANFQLPWDESK